MNLSSCFLVNSLVVFGGLSGFAQEPPDVRKVEERTRYAVNQGETARFEVDVIVRHLGHEMNSTALIWHSSMEVAEQRSMRLSGNYRVEKSPDEQGIYVALVFSSDEETGRFASAEISGFGNRVVTIRIVSWGLSEEEHRNRIPDLVRRFRTQKEPNKPVQETPAKAADPDL